MKSDVLTFGDAFRRKDPKKWKEVEQDWEENLSNIEVTVHVTSKIKRIGMKSEPVKIGK